LELVHIFPAFMKASVLSQMTPILTSHAISLIFILLLCFHLRLCFQVVLELLRLNFFSNQVKWVHCHHVMARPRVADRGDGLQIWRVVANILNKQLRTAGRGRPSSYIYCKICTRASEVDGFSGTTQAQNRDRWRALVNKVMTLRVLAPRS
jgi:hypothetical protein